jgi:hypothetical protein
VDIVSRLDSVEVKVTLGKEHVPAALRAFGLTAAEGQERLIYFCEDVTPQTSAGTPLLDAHVILRARTWAGDNGDTTVKLRPARQTQLSARWVPFEEVEYGDVKEELKVQADWAGVNRALAMSYSVDGRAASIEAVRAGERPVGDLFTATQREFLADCAGTSIQLDALSVLGPVRAVRWSSVPTEPAGAGLSLRAERWTLDRLDFLELSIEAKPADARGDQKKLTKFVGQTGFKVERKQQPKTTLVLKKLVEQFLAQPR